MAVWFWLLHLDGLPVNFSKHFIKHMNVSRNNPAVLVMNNHEIHLRLQTIDISKKNWLIILTLPPYYKDKVQSLDVSIYTLLQQCLLRLASDPPWKSNHHRSICARASTKPSLQQLSFPITTKPKYII